jgi:hypothetical protein
VSPHASFIYADQTYRVSGKSGTAARVQFIDANNLPLNINREIILNSVSIPVPTRVVQLDAQALADIQANGVYRGPFDLHVLPRLQEAEIRRELAGFLQGILGLVQALPHMAGPSSYGRQALPHMEALPHMAGARAEGGHAAPLGPDGRFDRRRNGACTRASHHAHTSHHFTSHL